MSTTAMLTRGVHNGREPWPSFRSRRRRRLDPDVAALLARMTAAPGAERTARIGRLVADLKAAGIWDKLAILHVHAAHDAQAAALNWRDATFTATSVNAPVFTVDRGFAGDGATSYLDLGAGYAAVPLIGLSDHCELVWSLSDIASTVWDAGSATGGFTTVMGRSTAGVILVRGNVATNAQAVTATSLGLYGFSRNGGSTDVVKNGAVLATQALAATQFGTGNLNTLRSTGLYSTRQIAARVVARHLAAAEQAALHAALGAYMGAVGAA